MTYDFSAKSAEELERLVTRRRQAGQTDTDYYIDAVRSLDARRQRSFDLKRTLDFLIEAAKKRECVSYKGVAMANGLEWNIKVRSLINGHLDLVCQYTFGKKLPLLTAIVVPKDRVADGSMTTQARNGFMASVEKLGIHFDDAELFVRAEQQRVFDYFSRDQTS